MWSECDLPAPGGDLPGGLVFKAADEVAPSGARRRLLWLADPDGGCVSHLWFFRAVYADAPMRPGYVHDMVTAADLRNQGLLRLLVGWARALQPCGSPLYCDDRGLTTDGGRVAVRLGLIAAGEYRADRADRPSYRQLRGCDHLPHPVHGLAPSA
ncbi:hypothetical protein [Virgisporangium aurantiacum]|uniref:Uncharacterized protein n=1 Tax=Virgisporangium aurantiacum TaxID=175570 RepID=A0A8J3ZNP6_9ACTN|nr:hypothetical protein [Virgisporangium aurantiacum]GIJ64790.1 hypothetical protein Vau01_123060 [Virgisporangium aurantiacum]